MGAGRFRGSGSSGPLTTQSWFPLVPDRVNMLRPGLPTWTGAPSGSANTIYTSKVAANYVSQWERGQPGSATVDTANANYYVSFSAATAAPDGTTTGVKIIESSDGGATTHYLTAMSRNQTGANDGPRKFRLAVFAKAAERTRIVLTLTDAPMNAPAGSNPGDNGVKAVFDLSAGTVAVATAVIGGLGGFPNIWLAPDPAQITPFGDGWYRCIIDGSAPASSVTSGRVTMGTIKLDSGSGNAAESSSYTGNGTSGCYVWRSNLLPARAWEMNNKALFNDFNTTEEIARVDVNDTLQPGFDIYVHHKTPLQQHLLPISAANIQFANSCLISKSSVDAENAGYCSVGWTGTNINTHTGPAYTVGKGYGLPLLSEFKMKYIVPTSGAEDGFTGCWNMSVLSMMETSPAFSTAWPVYNNVVEFDCFEAQGFDATPKDSTPVTSVHFRKPPNTSVLDISNNMYEGTDNSWTEPDWTVFHTYSNLWIPADRYPNDTGWFMTFFDGALTLHLDFPYIQASSYFASTVDPTGSDRFKQFIGFDGGNPSGTTQWDYVLGITQE